MPRPTHYIRRHCSKPAVLLKKQPARTETHDLLFGAKEVYEALCSPSLQRVGNFDIACNTIPARHVSGDFVTSFEVNGSHFFALGDLMGKGLAAAMWLTHVLDLIRRCCELSLSLPEIMQTLNREMYRSRVAVPMTSLFLMRLDPHESRLAYSCGGCPPALLLRHDAACITKLDRGGPILGAVEHATYSAATIDFAPSDTLLVVSDGISEAHHSVRSEPHHEPIASHLQFSSGHSATCIVKSLLARVPQSPPMIPDDLTALAIQRVA